MLVDQLDEEPTAGRVVDGGDHAEHDGQHVHHPDVQHPGDISDRQHDGLGREQGLRGEHDASPVDPIGKGPGPGPKHEQRSELEGGEDPNGGRRAGEPVDDDSEHGELRPGADLRDEQAAEEESRVSVPERPERTRCGDRGAARGVGHRSAPHQSSSLRAEMNTSPGTSTRPIAFIFFLPSFCFSSSFLFRVMSPP